MDAGTDPYLDRPRIEAFSLDQPRDGMMRDLLDRPGPSGVDGGDDAAVRIVQQQRDAVCGEYADEHAALPGVERIACGDRIVDGQCASSGIFGRDRIGVGAVGLHGAAPAGKGKGLFAQPAAVLHHRAGFLARMQRHASAKGRSAIAQRHGCHDRVIFKKSQQVHLITPDAIITQKHVSEKSGAPACVRG